MLPPGFACLSLLLGLTSALSSCRLPASSPENQFVPPLSAQETNTISTTQSPARISPRPESVIVTAPSANAVQVNGLPAASIQMLPGSLYFLSTAASRETQVWRLAADGSTLTQLTHQPLPMGVEDYDVSPLDGKVVYTTGSRLMLQGFPEESPILLFDGGSQNPLQHIQAPRWSSDGRRLAFGFGGIWIYNSDSGRIQFLLPDDNPSQGSSSVQYLPIQWSPEGSHLLVSQNREKFTALGLLSIDPVSFMPLIQGPACCQAGWAPDGHMLLVANPFPALAETGLWQYDASTGQGQPLIPAQSPDQTYNLVGWPLLVQDHRLAYFYGNYPSLLQGEIPLQPFIASLERPLERLPMRPESSFVREVLWSTSGESAVLVLPPPGATSELAGGPLVFIHQDGRPAQPLVPNGYALRWGP